MEWMNNWLSFVNESKFVAIPYGCKLVKKQQHRNAFLKKIPIAQGGGEREMMKIKKVEEYECFIKNTPQEPNKPAPKNPPMKDTKKESLVMAETKNQKSGKIERKGIVIRIGEFEKN